MKKYKLSQKSVSDLKSIGEFTFQKWGIEKRNDYLKQFFECFERLSKNPNLGTRCDYIRIGYRKIMQGRHIVFCRIESGIEIVRILHKSMDAELHF